MISKGRGYATLPAKLMVTAAILLLAIGCDFSANAPQGPPASWRTLVDTAQQAAWKVDKDAVLYDVSAFPPKLPVPWTITDTLDVHFRFSGSSHDTIVVSMNDAVPTSTLRVKVDGSKAPDSVQGKAQAYVEGFSQVMLGPRQAIDQVYKDQVQQATSRGIETFPIVGLDPRAEPAHWRIQFRDASKPLDIHNLGYDLLYVVDAGTGSVIEKNYEPWDPDLITR